MANRYYRNQAFTLEPAVVKLFAKVTFGGAGAATLDTTQSKGIVSVTHDGTGLYTFVFGTSASSKDVYYKMLFAKVGFDVSGASNNAPAAPIMAINANSVATASACSVQLKFWDKAEVGVADPASGEVGYFEFTFKNSNAQ